jgi:N-acetylmuramic acid 6-phosphate etherase
MLDPRETERRNVRTAAIDLASPLEIVDLINAEDRQVPDVVATQREQIARGIELAEATFRAGGRLF